jgi:hypothetical protein
MHNYVMRGIKVHGGETPIQVLALVPKTSRRFK